jgi:hypothetical protein
MMEAEIVLLGYQLLLCLGNLKHFYVGCAERRSGLQYVLVKAGTHPPFGLGI